METFTQNIYLTKRETLKCVSCRKSMAIVQLSVEWLTHSSSTKILDIGSGIGKFCIAGSLISDAEFTGVEKRRHLVKEAKKVKVKLKAKKVIFLNKNITKVDFTNHNSFYYFNPFCEQIATTDWIDETVEFSETKFKIYEQYVKEQLGKVAIGSRVVTYCSDSDVIPSGYILSDINYNGQLQLWIKKH